MDKTTKSILSFLLFAGIYFFPIFITIFLLGFLVITNLSYFADSGQSVGWIMIIISCFISTVLSILLSILTVKKIVLRKVKEDGTTEKIPKYILFFIIIALLFNVVLVGFLFVISIFNMDEANYNIVEPVVEPIIYDIDALSDISEFGKDKFISNSYMHEIKENHEDNYIVNFNNLNFKNNLYRLSYQVSNNKKVISINDKEIINKQYIDENLGGIAIYKNNLKITEIIFGELNIHKSIILDSNLNILYDYYEFMDVNNPYNAFQIVNDMDKNNIGYIMYKLILNNDNFEINDLVKLNFSCKDYQIRENILTEEDEIKYYICNN